MFIVLYLTISKGPTANSIFFSVSLQVGKEPNVMEKTVDVHFNFEQPESTPTDIVIWPLGN